MNKEKLKWYLKEGVRNKSYQKRFDIPCDFPQDEVEIMIDEIIDELFSQIKTEGRSILFIKQASIFLATKK